MSYTTDKKESKNAILTLGEIKEQLQRMEFIEDELLSGAIPVEALDEVLGKGRYLDIGEEVLFFAEEGLVTIPHSIGMSHRMNGAYRILHREDFGEAVIASVIHSVEKDAYDLQFKNYDNKLERIETLLSTSNSKSASKIPAPSVKIIANHLHDLCRKEEVDEAPLSWISEFADESNCLLLQDHLFVVTPEDVVVAPCYLGANEPRIGDDSFENQYFLHLNAMHVPNEEQKAELIPIIQQERERIRSVGFLS